MVTRHTMTTSLSPGIDNARDGNIVILVRVENKTSHKWHNINDMYQDKTS